MIVDFAGRVGRCVAVAALVWLAGIAPALAQASRPASTPSRPTPARPAAPAKTGECAALPGGKAPVEKIAALTTALSPRDLDLVYFGKPLAELTEDDFRLIGELSQRCGTGAGILPEDKRQRFQEVVREAQQVRRATLDKVKRQMTDIVALPIARDKLTRLNGLQDNLTLLEPVLTRGDVQTTATWIARQMQTVYDAAPKAASAVPAVEQRPMAVAATPPAGPASTGRPRSRSADVE